MKASLKSKNYQLVQSKKSKKQGIANDKDSISDMEISRGEITAESKEVRVPPIKIIPPDNWSLLLNEDKRVALSTQRKLKGKYLNLNFENVDYYRQAQKLLINWKVQYHSYMLEDAKPLRVVIRGLPANT